MLSLEEILYMSLAAGLLVGLALSRGPGKGVRAVDLISTASILALVFSMGLVVGSELTSIRGQAITIVGRLRRHSRAPRPAGVPHSRGPGEKT